MSFSMIYALNVNISIKIQEIDETAGNGASFTPTWTSLVVALLIGSIIPLIAAIYPVVKMTNMPIVEGISSSSTRMKEQYKIALTGKGNKIKYVTVGMIFISYSIAIYYFMPLSIISNNLFILFNIFFIILIAMLIGFIYLSFSLTYIVELILIYIFLLCW